MLLFKRIRSNKTHENTNLNMNCGIVFWLKHYVFFFDWSTISIITYFVASVYRWWLKKFWTCGAETQTPQHNINGFPIKQVSTSRACEREVQGIHSTQCWMGSESGSWEDLLVNAHLSSCFETQLVVVLCASRQKLAGFSVFRFNLGRKASWISDGDLFLIFN